MNIIFLVSEQKPLDTNKAGLLKSQNMRRDGTSVFMKVLDFGKN